MSASLRARISPKDTWDTIASRISGFLQLPDILTEAGLTAAERNLPQVHRNLLNTFDQHSDFELAQAGVVIVWARLCSSLACQDFLIHHGILSKVKPLLAASDVRIITLQSLSAISQVATGPTRLTLAKETMPMLLSILRNEVKYSSDARSNPRVMELALKIVLGTLYAALTYRKKNHVLNNCGFDLAEVVRIAVDCLRTPRSTFAAYSLVVIILRQIMEFHSNIVFANPSIVSLAVASFRSSNLALRAEALAALTKLCAPHCDNSRHDRSGDAIAALIDNDTMPLRVAAALSMGSEILRAHNARQRFLSAMHKVVRDKDLHSLGSTFSQLIMDTEESIIEGNFVDLPPGAIPFLATGEKHGLPFDEWSNALPCCAKVIRATGTPADADLADVLDLKNFHLSREARRQHELAATALQRNPDNAFFYWALATGSNDLIGLRLAKKGLRLNKSSHFLSLKLHDEAIVQAYNMGCELMVGDETRITEAVAILTCCSEDCATLASICPVDAYDLQKTLCIHILVSLCLKGGDLSDDLKEIQYLVDRLRLVNDTFKYFYGTIGKSVVARIVQLILPEFASAMREWGPMISRLNSSQGKSNHASVPGTPVASADMGAESTIWLSGSDGPPAFTAVVDEIRLPLLFCSYCRTPDAQVQRCSRCSKARYCDAYCQKKDWKKHRSACASSDGP